MNRDEKNRCSLFRTGQPTVKSTGEPPLCSQSRSDIEAKPSVMGLDPILNSTTITPEVLWGPPKTLCPTHSTLYLCVDRHGVIHQRNTNQTPSIFPIFPEDVIGKRIQDILPSSLLAGIEQTIREVFAHQQIVCREYQISAETSTYWIEAYFTPIGDEKMGVLLCNIKPRKQIEIAHEIIIQEMNPVTQESFFPNLASQLAIALNLSEVAITQLIDDQLETLGCYANGQRQDKISYDYLSTPCALTLILGSYHCPHSIQTHFPDNPKLFQGKAESYIGVAIQSSEGKRLGTIYGLSQEPLRDIVFAKSILRVVSAKAAAEIERLIVINDLETLNVSLEERVHERTQALKQSEKDLRTIFDTAYDAIYIHDLDGNLLDMNESAHKLHGLPREVMLKLTVEHYTSPEEEKVDQLPELIANTSHDETIMVEWKGYDFNNPHRPLDMEVALRRAFLSDQEILIATMRSVRERKQRELAMKTIIEGTAAKKGQDFYQICIQSLGEILNIKFAFLTKLDHQPEAKHQILTIYEQEEQEESPNTPCLSRLYDETLRQEWGIIPTNLQKCYPDLPDIVKLEVNSYLGVTVRDSQNNPLGILGVLDTKTLAKDTKTAEFILQMFSKHIAGEMERQAAEDKLYESKQLLQSVLNTIPQSVFWKDKQSVYLGCNQAFAEISGFQSPEEVIGRTDFEMPWKPEEAQLYKTVDSQVMENDQAKLGIIEPHLQKDGQVIWLETNKVPLHSPEGDVIGILGALQDITVRVKAETTLKELNEELEKRVKKRTRDLSNAIQRADHANHAKSEFLANMSHELRTPLNGILGYAQILERSQYLGERDQKGVAVIKQCGTHLLTLINDILDLSKIEAQKLDLNPTPSHLPSLLAGVVEICKVRIDPQHVEFKVDWPENLPEHIMVDEKRLRQILLNLIGNAIKFTDSGVVQFKVSWLNSNSLISTQSCQLQFEIIDNGIGISEEYLSRLFNAFEQVSLPSRQAEGTGLGLAISQRIVKLMGSVIQVKSELEVGSTFFFTLDLPVVQSAILAPAQDGPTITGYEGDRQKILVVDDRWENRGVFLNLLEPLGFEIEVAENGELALLKLAKSLPDIVILDLAMPIMNGFQLLKIIRRNPRLASLRVIVCSASVSKEEIAKSLSMGGDDFLMKPISSEHLFEMLKTHLHLKWIYAQPIKPKINPSKTSGDLNLPPPETLAQLLALSQTGRLKKLTQVLQGLSQKDSEYSAFSEQIIALAKQFKAEEVEKLLTSFVEGEE